MITKSPELAIYVGTKIMDRLGIIAKYQKLKDVMILSKFKGNNKKLFKR